MKVANIVGARPQFIKYFPIMKALRRTNAPGNEAIEDLLVHTGQHYDYAMSRSFFDEFSLKEPDHHLNVGSGSHGFQTSEIMKRLEPVLQNERPDVVVVYGDTNSTLAAALTASKLHLPVAHIEAGLRSFNKGMPEEINRVLTDHISTLLFCPSKAAVENLKKEGVRHATIDGDLIDLHDRQDESAQVSIDSPGVCNVGDVMYDVLLQAASLAATRSTIMQQMDLSPGEFCLLTIHRAESTDSPADFARLVHFVNEATAGMRTVMPMHPRTRKIYEHSTAKFEANVAVTEPVGYFDMVALIRRSALVLTDSGGMQKEAYWLKVPCVTLRRETEWIETVASGWNVLYEDYTGSHRADREYPACYGDGQAAPRIVRIIGDTFGRTPE